VSGHFIDIEIAAPDGSFHAGEFENLKAGDRFRVSWPPERANGIVCHCETDAVPPGPDDAEGNWSVKVHRVDMEKKTP
jgi:hypothetical protein